MIVTDSRIGAFIAERLNYSLCPPYSFMGWERDGEIKCAVLFNCFEGADVHIGAVGGGWTRGFIRAVGDYVYRQLGCERMTITTEHEQVAGYAERLGGVREGVMRSHFGPGRDGIIIGILKAEFRLT